MGQAFDPVKEDMITLTMFIILNHCVFVFFFGTFFSISVLKQDPRYTPKGPLRAVTQLRLSTPKTLTQLLKFCTSVTKCKLLLFILFTLSSPCPTLLLQRTSPGSPVLPVRLAEP